MKTEIDVLKKIIALYDAGLRPQIIRGMHREEQDFHECVAQSRVIIARHEIKCARRDRDDYAHKCAIEDAYPGGQGA